MAQRSIKPPKITGYTYKNYLGSGGFADVFMYEQHLPKRNVAVKVWHDDIPANVRERFVDEANVMAAVSSHPSIIEIYSAGIAKDGRPYLVMEYCQPPNLGKRVKDQPYTLQQALETGIYLAGAVETAHRAKIIHRDIKPSNILINRYGRPVLTDFGIASTSTLSYRPEGASLAWSSPEQQRGLDAPGPRTDIFALGATIHAMLTGDSPFRVPGGDNSVDMLRHRIFNQEYALTGRADVPAELESVLGRCLKKNPFERFSRALDLAHALQSIQRNNGFAITEVTVFSEDGSDSGDISSQSTLPASFQQLPRLETRIDTGDETRLGRLIDGYDISADQAFRFTAPKVEAFSAPVPKTMASTATYAPPDSLRPQAPPPVVEAKPQRSPWSMVAAIAGVIVVLVIGALVGYSLWSGQGSTVSLRDKPKETEQAQDAGLSAVAPPVEDLKAKKHAKGAEVSWKNPDPKKGDFYLYQVIGETEGDVKKTTSTSVVVPWKEGSCIEVTLCRQHGQPSQAKRVCALNP